MICLRRAALGLVSFAVVAFGCGHDGDRPAGLRFAKLVAEPGQSLTATSDSDLSVSFRSPDPGSRSVSSSSTDESLAYTEEVLAATGGRPVQLRITFQRVAETVRAGGTKVRTTRAIAGKAYLVEWLDGTTVVSDPAGHPVARLEADEVRQYIPPLGAPDPVLDAVPTSPVRLGDHADALARAVADEVKRDTQSDTAEGARATYRGAAGDDGVFNVRVTMSKDVGVWRLSSDLTGELHVSTRTGRATELRLGGPVTARPKCAAAPPSGPGATGTMRVHLRQSLS